MDRKIVLASKSPRRIELFEKYRIDAEIRPASADETVPEDVTEPSEIVKLLAERKAKAVAAKCGEDTVVVGADTLVFCDGKILGKPHSTEEARDMMRLLSGRSHSVISGLCVCDGKTTVTESVETAVTFRDLSEEEIEAYISTSDPYDKAGGYGIQSMAGAFVSGINGDYYNVVGLPVERLLYILKHSFGCDFFARLCEKSRRTV